MIIGKENEIIFIKKWIRNNKKFLIIFGNNGIGKTYLLKYLFPNNFINNIDNYPLKLIIIDNIEKYNKDEFLKIKELKNNKIILISNNNYNNNVKIFNNADILYFKNLSKNDIKNYINKVYNNNIDLNIFDYRKINYIMKSDNINLDITYNRNIYYKIDKILYGNIENLYFLNNEKKIIFNTIDKFYINILNDINLIKKISKINLNFMNNINNKYFNIINNIFNSSNKKKIYISIKSPDIYFLKMINKKNIVNYNLSVNDNIYCNKITNNIAINKLKI